MPNSDKKFFTDTLNYSLANEDNIFERELVKKLSSKKILSICGSGLRSLVMLQNGVEKLDLIDVSQVQIDWARLREKTIKEYSYPNYLSFWGYRKAFDRKQIYFDDIKNDFPSLVKIFESNSWEEPNLYGQWEKTFVKLASFAKLILRTKNLEKLKNCQTLEEQKAIYYSAKFRYKWKLVLFTVGNKSVFNRLLYKGDFVEKNIKKSHYKYYLEAFDKLMNLSLVKDNFFLQLSLFGELWQESTSVIESDQNIFESIKKASLNADISYFVGDIFSVIEKRDYKYDFVSFSDVPSYFKGDIEKSFLNSLESKVETGGVVVVRYYLKECNPDLKSFKDVTSSYSDLINKEKTQMYTIKLYQRL